MVCRHGGPGAGNLTATLATAEPWFHVLFVSHSVRLVGYLFILVRRVRSVRKRGTRTSRTKSPNDSCSRARTSSKTPVSSGVTSRRRISRSTRVSRAPSSTTTSLTSFPTCTGKGLASARETATKVAPISPCQTATRAKKLTESKEGEKGDDKSRALHVERVGIERRQKKVLSQKATENRGETGQMRDPILQKLSL